MGIPFTGPDWSPDPSAIGSFVIGQSQIGDVAVIEYRSPAAGSNGIGEFAIGVSQIGDIPSFDWVETLCGQYANSPAITSLIGSFAAAADQTGNFQLFYDDVWNIETAQGWGLQVLGAIVGVSNVVTVASTAGFFGFAEGGGLTFDTGGGSGPGQGGGVFYSGAPVTSNYTLEGESYRLAVKAKAAANICDCSIPAINQILLNLFPNRGNAYVTEGYQGAPFFGFAESVNAGGFAETGSTAVFYDSQSLPSSMFMTYTFDFPLSAVEYAIVSQSGILPAPCGVQIAVQVNA